MSACVAPALSPDGNQMVFFSARDLFSIDLFLADPRTGQIKRRITQTALDPHYQSLEFIASAGAWDAAGRRIALGAVANGKAVLSILDAASGRVEREIPLPAGTAGFTFCQVPVVLHRGGPARMVVTAGRGERVSRNSLELDGATSAAIFERTGEVVRLDVHLPVTAAGGAAS